MHQCRGTVRKLQSSASVHYCTVSPIRSHHQVTPYMYTHTVDVAYCMMHLYLRRPCSACRTRSAPPRDQSVETLHPVPAQRRQQQQQQWWWRRRRWRRNSFSGSRGDLLWGDDFCAAQRHHSPVSTGECLYNSCACCKDRVHVGSVITSQCN